MGVRGHATSRTAGGGRSTGGWNAQWALPAAISPAVQAETRPGASRQTPMSRPTVGRCRARGEARRLWGMGRTRREVCGRPSCPAVRFNGAAIAEVAGRIAPLDGVRPPTAYHGDAGNGPCHGLSWPVDSTRCRPEPARRCPVRIPPPSFRSNSTSTPLRPCGRPARASCSSTAVSQTSMRRRTSPARSSCRWRRSPHDSTSSNRIVRAASSSTAIMAVAACASRASCDSGASRAPRTWPVASMPGRSRSIRRRRGTERSPDRPVRWRPATAAE